MRGASDRHSARANVPRPVLNKHAGQVTRIEFDPQPTIKTPAQGLSTSSQ